MTAGPSKQEADEIEAAAIFEFLRTQLEPIEERAILDGVEGRRGLKVKGLRRLVSEGKVTKAGKGGKGAPYKYSCSGLFGNSVTVANHREQEKPPSLEPLF